TFAKVKVIIQAALAKVEGVVKGAVQIIARLTYRQRYEQSTGRDPLICPYCRGEMGVWRIWHPTYGVIPDEVQLIKPGTYASTAQRAGPGGKGGCAKSPPAGRFVPAASGTGMSCHARTCAHTRKIASCANVRSTLYASPPSRTWLMYGWELTIVISPSNPATGPRAYRAGRPAKARRERAALA